MVWEEGDGVKVGREVGGKAVFERADSLQFRPSAIEVRQRTKFSGGEAKKDAEVSPLLVFFRPPSLPRKTNGSLVLRGGKTHLHFASSRLLSLSNRKVPKLFTSRSSVTFTNP